MQKAQDLTVFQSSVVVIPLETKYAKQTRLCMDFVAPNIADPLYMIFLNVCKFLKVLFILLSISFE